MGMVAVVTTVESAGQSVTVGPQLVTVTRLVAYSVEMGVSVPAMAPTAKKEAATEKRILKVCWFGSSEERWGVVRMNVVAVKLVGCFERMDDRSQSV
jgi:hypothetical protein